MSLGRPSPDGSPCAPRKLMDKQTFCSSQTTSNTSRYAAALYRQGTRGWPSRGRVRTCLGSNSSSIQTPGTLGGDCLPRAWKELDLAGLCSWVTDPPTVQPDWAQWQMSASKDEGRRTRRFRSLRQEQTCPSQDGQGVGRALVASGARGRVGWGLVASFCVDEDACGAGCTVSHMLCFNDLFIE